MSQPMTPESSPYIELDRSAWAALSNGLTSSNANHVVGNNVHADHAADAAHITQPLSAAEIEQLRGLGDGLDMDEVQQIYLPLSRLLSLYVESAAALHRKQVEFLGHERAIRTPFVIGLAGSVAVGKSTTARVLRQLLAHRPEHPKVDLVTTDGFLYPNAVLAERGILDRKGYPESYDKRALLRFVVDLKSGRDHVAAPTYSHLIYDVTDEVVHIHRPDIVIIEGLNVLQPAAVRADGRTGLAISDLFDFSVYIDAAQVDIRRWYTDRFLALRETAFRDPQSYFAKYATLSHDAAVDEARRLWDTINGPNLSRNIAPTRSRAELVLRKGTNHSVRSVRLRKL